MCPYHRSRMHTVWMTLLLVVLLCCGVAVVHADEDDDEHEEALTAYIACRTPVSGSSSLFWFGAWNSLEENVEVSVGGSKNRFNPPPFNRGQPSVFSPGNHPFLFSLELSYTPPKRWSLRSSEAAATEEHCPLCSAASGANATSISPVELHSNQLTAFVVTGTSLQSLTSVLIVGLEDMCKESSSAAVIEPGSLTSSETSVSFQATLGSTNKDQFRVCLKFSEEAEYIFFTPLFLQRLSEDHTATVTGFTPTSMEPQVSTALEFSGTGMTSTALFRFTNSYTASCDADPSLVYSVDSVVAQSPSKLVVMVTLPYAGHYRVCAKLDSWSAYQEVPGGPLVVPGFHADTFSPTTRTISDVSFALDLRGSGFSAQDQLSLVPEAEGSCGSVVVPGVSFGSVYLASALYMQVQATVRIPGRYLVCIRPTSVSGNSWFRFQKPVSALEVSSMAPPQPPRDVEVISTTQNSMVLRWKRNLGFPSADKYEVALQEKLSVEGETTTRTFVFSVNENQEVITKSLTSLVAQGIYSNIRVFALFGSLKHPEPAVLNGEWILPAGPPAPVSKFRVVSVNASAVDLGWDHPGSTVAIAFVVRYRFWNPEGTSSSLWVQHKVLTLEKGFFGSHTASVLKLQAESRYEFQMQSVSQYGASGWTDSVFALTSLGPPLPVLRVTGRFAGQDLQLNWDRPMFWTPGVTLSYLVRRYDTSGNLVQQHTTVKTEIIIGGLTPGTMAVYVVHAVNSHGLSTESSRLTLQVPVEDSGSVSVFALAQHLESIEDVVISIPASAVPGVEGPSFNFTLVFPSNSISEEMLFSFSYARLDLLKKILPSYQLPEAPGLVETASTTRFVFGDPSERSSIMFAKPVTLRIPVDNLEFQHKNFTLRSFNHTLSAWTESLQDCQDLLGLSMEDLVNTVNETTGIWSVSLCHCTEFAVFGVAPSQEPTPGGGGGVSVVVIAASAGGAGFLLVILIFFLGRWFLFRRRQAVEQRIHAQKATEVEATDAAKIPKLPMPAWERQDSGSWTWTTETVNSDDVSDLSVPLSKIPKITLSVGSQRSLQAAMAALDSAQENQSPFRVVGSESGDGAADSSAGTMPLSSAEIVERYRQGLLAKTNRFLRPPSPVTGARGDDGGVEIGGRNGGGDAGMGLGEITLRGGGSSDEEEGGAPFPWRHGNIVDWGVVESGSPTTLDQEAAALAATFEDLHAGREFGVFFSRESPRQGSPTLLPLHPEELDRSEE